MFTDAGNISIQGPSGLNMMNSESTLSNRSLAASKLKMHQNMMQAEELSSAKAKAFGSSSYNSTPYRQQHQWSQNNIRNSSSHMKNKANFQTGYIEGNGMGFPQ